MWVTCFVLLAAAQGIVGGYRHHPDNTLDDYSNEEDIYKDLDNWSNPADMLNAPASKPSTISAAEHALKAAQAVLEAKKYADQALAAAKKAAEAAALAAKHSKAAAHASSAAASTSASSLAKVPGAIGSSTSKPGSPAAAAAKPGSSAAVGVKKPAAPSSSKPTSSSGTPTSSKATSPPPGSLAFELRFPNYRYTPAMSTPSSPDAIRLTSRMCTAIRAIFKKGEVTECKIQSVRSGSIIVKLFLRFVPSVNVKEALERIKKAISSGYLSGLPVQKTLVGSPALGKPKGSGCTPCNKQLAAGVKMIGQSQCPTGYCATLMINPSQVMQAAAAPAPAAPQPAPQALPAYPPPMMAPQPTYTACPSMCQAPQLSCPPACPPACCSSMG